MLLTISTTHRPATDLGFLLEKHPGRAHRFDVAGGKATVFYSEATEERCTVCVSLDIDPIGLVRGPGRKKPANPEQYVNDRPYVASSFLSVAMGTAFRSALAGKSRSRPELANTPIPLEASIAVLPARGGEDLLRSLFEPLGYTLVANPIPLDSSFPDWGMAPYYSVTLRAEKTLRELLQHLHVLIPVLDDQKHYWVGDAEVEKLMRHAGDWLGGHPEKDRIVRRYLKHRRSLATDALARLAIEEEGDVTGLEDDSPGPQLRERKLEERIGLNERRIAAVASTIDELGSKSVVDLGCGEGRLLEALMKSRVLERLVGMDVSMRSLEYADERLRLDRLPSMQRDRVKLLHGSLIYRDERLSGFDVATVIEVIEHLDPGRLAAFEKTLFKFVRPAAILLTTPNREFNKRFPLLAAGEFRHIDHRFEWTRGEFRDWCARQAEQFGYSVAFQDIGELDPVLGPPTQMAVFRRNGAQVDA